jgi:hypothetical protein
MASFPAITSPCPLRWRALPGPGRDFCTFCEKRVHNLDRMGEAERSALLASRDGSICVAYTLRRAALSTLSAAAIAGTLAAAQAEAVPPQPRFEPSKPVLPDIGPPVGEMPIAVGGLIGIGSELNGPPFEHWLDRDGAEFVAPPEKRDREPR